PSGGWRRSVAWWPPSSGCGYARTPGPFCTRNTPSAWRGRLATRDPAHDLGRLIGPAHGAVGHLLDACLRHIALERGLQLRREPQVAAEGEHPQPVAERAARFPGVVGDPSAQPSKGGLERRVDKDVVYPLMHLFRAELRIAALHNGPKTRPVIALE